MSNSFGQSLSDPIKALPTDQQSASPNELQIVNNLFKSKEQLSGIFGEFKDVLIAAGLAVLIFQFQFADKFIRGWGCNSDILVIGVKVIAFCILLVILKKRFE
jgi:hypothetical protein